MICSNSTQKNPFCTVFYYKTIHMIQIPDEKQIPDSMAARQHTPPTTVDVVHSSLTTIRRTLVLYHTHFGEPLGISWWDDRKRIHKPMLPIYLRSDISNVLSRALSCLRLSGHSFLVQRMRHNRNRRPYKLRICDKCDWLSVQDEEHILLDSVRMNILLAFAHSTASWSSHLSMRIA